MALEWLHPKAAGRSHGSGRGPFARPREIEEEGCTHRVSLRPRRWPKRCSCWRTQAASPGCWQEARTFSCSCAPVCLKPDLIVDTKQIPELRTITTEGGGYRIGASVSGAEAGEHEGLSKDWPGVVEAVELIGSTQIQGRASFVGNLCNASPAADSVPALVTVGATVVIAGPNGEREVPVEEVPTAPGRTSLAKGEMVIADQAAAEAGAHGRRLSALHSAHGNGHRRSRRRRLRDAGRERHMHRRRKCRSAPLRQPC